MSVYVYMCASVSVFIRMKMKCVYVCICISRISFLFSSKKKARTPRKRPEQYSFFTLNTCHEKHVSKGCNVLVTVWEA